MSILANIANSKRPGLIRESLGVLAIIATCFLWWIFV